MPNFNMTRGVTEISQEIHHLHMLIFWICLGIALVVFGLMFYAIIWHRKSRGAKAAHFHENLLIEIIWTLIPCCILVAMAIPAARLIIKTHNTEQSDLSIKVIGHQWYWEYEYLAEGIRIYSRLSTPQSQIENRDTKNPYYLREVDNPLVIPQNKKVRFLTTSTDVIHSWWVPDFGIKRDAVPGFINETWAKVPIIGVYRGQCAELCGALHGFMPIVVEVKSEADYQQWINEQKARKNT